MSQSFADLLLAIVEKSRSFAYHPELCPKEHKSLIGDPMKKTLRAHALRMTALWLDESAIVMSVSVGGSGDACSLIFEVREPVGAEVFPGGVGGLDQLDLF